MTTTNYPVMTAKFSWKKEMFSDSYQIFSEDNQVGSLREKWFSRTAMGMLNGNEYIFKTKGFVTQVTEIFDATGNTQIGKIAYNSWMTKAEITISNKLANWKTQNAWSTKWSIEDSDGNMITYAGSSSKGSIDSNMDDPILVLSGLYVSNYYWQVAVAIIIIIMIPILL